MRKPFGTLAVCILGASLGQAADAASVHTGSNSREWLRESAQGTEAQRLSYEARELDLHASSFIQPTDNGHPIQLQVKQGVPTAREPKWPSVPSRAIPKVGATELRPGTLQQQRAQIKSLR
jgi:hypothetical protein